MRLFKKLSMMNNLLTGKLNTVITDQYWNNVSLAMKFEGVNGSRIFTDYKNNIIRNYGNAQISTNTSRYGGSSLYLDGINSLLTVDNTPKLAFGKSDFTIDFSFNPLSLGDNVAGRSLLDFRPFNQNGPYISVSYGYQAQNKVVVSSNGSIFGTGITPIFLNTWNDARLVRNNSIIKLFINKILQFQQIDTTDYLVGDLQIGSGAFRNTAPIQHFHGYVDELIITKGIGRVDFNEGSFLTM